MPPLPYRNRDPRPLSTVSPDTPTVGVILVLVLGEKLDVAGLALLRNFANVGCFYGIFPSLLPRCPLLSHFPFAALPTHTLSQVQLWARRELPLARHNSPVWARHCSQLRPTIEARETDALPVHVQSRVLPMELGSGMLREISDKVRSTTPSASAVRHQRRREA